MKLLATSDTHGFLNGLDAEILRHRPDAVVFAGDIAPCIRGVNAREYVRGEFIDFVRRFRRTEFVVTPGNHDIWALEADSLLGDDAPDNFHFLVDAGCRLGGILFWGSPWVPCINGCWAFESEDELDESDIRERFRKIPRETDVLITHTPPKISGAQLDFSIQTGQGPFGSAALADMYSQRLMNPRFHFCGHIHSGTHDPVSVNDTVIYNVSRVDERYEVTYAPAVVEI